MSNQIKSMLENLIDEKEGVLKSIKAISKETNEEQNPRQLLNALIEKVETSLNFPGKNNVKDTFKVLIDIMTADFIVRLMDNVDQTTLASLLKKEVFDGITRFGLATMFLYPHLLENKLELKTETRDLTEEEITSISNVKKSVKIVAYLSYFGISPIEIMTVLLAESLVTEKELYLIGLTEKEVSLARDGKQPDKQVRNTVINLYKNFDSIASGKLKADDLSVEHTPENKELN